MPASHLRALYHMITKVMISFCSHEAMHAAPYFIVYHFLVFSLFLAVSQHVEPVFVAGPSGFGLLLFLSRRRFSSTPVADPLPASFQSDGRFLAVFGTYPERATSRVQTKFAHAQSGGRTWTHHNTLIILGIVGLA